MNGTADKTGNLGDIVYEEVYLGAKKMGLGQSLSADLAGLVDEGIKRRCGGDRAYVPAQSKEIRDMRIINAKINGESSRSIARRESISKSQVCRIVKQYGF